MSGCAVHHCTYYQQLGLSCIRCSGVASSPPARNYSNVTISQFGGLACHLHNTPSLLISSLSVHCAAGQGAWRAAQCPPAALFNFARPAPQ